MSTLPTGIKSPEFHGNLPKDYDDLFLIRIENAKSRQEEALTKGNDAQAQTIQKEIDELVAQKEKSHSQPV